MGNITVREIIEQLEKDGVSDIILHAEASGEELPLSDSNLDTELCDYIVIGDIADLYM